MIQPSNDKVNFLTVVMWTCITCPLLINKLPHTVHVQYFLVAAPRWQFLHNMISIMVTGQFPPSSPVQKYRYRVSAKNWVKSIADTVTDTGFQKYCRYWWRYRKSIADSIASDIDTAILTTLHIIILNDRYRNRRI